jgi:hypothetical protein
MVFESRESMITKAGDAVWFKFIGGDEPGEDV